MTGDFQNGSISGRGFFLLETIKAMFVSRNSLSGKLFFKFFCVCLPLRKLVNGKHFPVNGNTFRSTENTFQSTETLFGQRKTFSSQRKIWFGLVFRKVFSLLAVFVFRKMVSGKPLSKLSCVCLPLKKLINGKNNAFRLIKKKRF